MTIYPMLLNAVRGLVERTYIVSRDAASEKELILLNKNFFVRPRLNEKTNLFVFRKESRGIISHDLVFAEAAELPWLQARSKIGGNIFAYPGLLKFTPQVLVNWQRFL